MLNAVLIAMSLALPQIENWMVWDLRISPGKIQHEVLDCTKRNIESDFIKSQRRTGQLFCEWNLYKQKKAAAASAKDAADFKQADDKKPADPPK